MFAQKQGNEKRLPSGFIASLDIETLTSLVEADEFRWKLLNICKNYWYCSVVMCIDEVVLGIIVKFWTVDWWSSFFFL